MKKIAGCAFLSNRSLERFNFPSISNRLDNIIVKAGQTEVENKIGEIRGSIERRGSELYILKRDMNHIPLVGHDWITLRQSLNRIIRLITFYEMKEATTLFELALWKAKIDQASEMARPCRVEVPGPVKETILRYAYPALVTQNGDTVSDSEISSGCDCDGDDSDTDTDTSRYL